MDKYEMEQEIIATNEAKLHLAHKNPIQQGEINRIVMDADFER